ncbi:hypothetical protein G6514_005686 [Epicoccum nigrum]|nr:hypothetical protein G6514_005686 [Epicoccum nigrum]
MSVDSTGVLREWTCPDSEHGSANFHQSSQLTETSEAFVSPYAESEVVALSLGGSQIRYLIHSQILRKSPPLYALASNEQTFSLPELDPTLAHPLIHYLYAGTLEWDFEYPVGAKFGIATRMYFAAIQYELPGLAELAKEEIMQSSENLNILYILWFMKQNMVHYRPEKDTWYKHFLEDAIQKAFEGDLEPFKSSDFITGMEGNSWLLQIVWKVVMSNYTSMSLAASSVRDVNSAAETSLAESTLTESKATMQDDVYQLASPIESVIGSTPVLKEAHGWMESQELELDASASSTFEGIAPPPPEEPVPVPDTVEDDKKSNLPDTVSPASQSQAVQVVSVPVENVREPEHIRADSVVAEDAVAPVGLKKKNKKKFKSKKKKDPPAVV